MKFNIAIIGCGRVAWHHCQNILKISNLDVVAVCDLNKDLSRNFGDRLKCLSYTNYHIMLKENPSIDIVSICTPSGMHFEHARDILVNYQKNLVIEKPICLKVSQVKTLYKLANKYKKKIFPVFQNRFNKAVQKIKSDIYTGTLGHPRMISIRLKWCRPQKYYDLSPWRGTFSHDGGAMTNQGIHHLDLLRYLGGEVNKVICITKTLGANIEVEDTSCAVVEFVNGAIGTIEITTAVRPTDDEAVVSLVCEKGIAEIGGIAVNILTKYSPSDKMKIKHSDDFNDLDDRGKVYGRGHHEFYKQVKKSLMHQKEFIISPGDCLKTIKLLNSLYISSETKKFQKVNTSGDYKKLGRSNIKISNLYRTKSYK